MDRICAVIVAGGRGSRMNSPQSKQFIEIKGKPIIYYTLAAFDNNPDIDDIILVLPKDEIQKFYDEVLKKFSFNKLSSIVQGGKQRQDSVYNGLKAVKDCSIVLIHDGARPFVSMDIIKEGIKYAEIYGACACGVIPKDTIKIRSKDNFSEFTPDRSALFAVQTPQCFKYDLILKCHEHIAEEGILVTDDTMAVEALGHRVYLYEGDYKNIKITTPEDLIVAEKLAENL
ncbi:2-C-methyl-D-erythritol 4-phosphate cytidylyltransferase [Clostridium polynesiense]|uniref:2-C-methyl-D-erythritol 4-phosphate cytidylyltransferase n=1 Tax=Clostridium polynesiense TaxID=1325933 RepID=UPI00058C6D8A|nr:2-C-methyl-D-erythritol 4-phosphate cytidylyltransferase [Clostridium polynesiense]